MATNTGELESGDHRTERSVALTNSLQLQAISRSPYQGDEKCFTAGQKKITMTKEELTLASTSHEPQANLDIAKKLDAEVYLKPKTIREGQSCSLEVRVEVRIKGRQYFHTIINKSQGCHIVVITTVMEHKSGLVLAHYTNKQPFSMPEDGYANYEWKLISYSELEKSSTEKVDICIELILHVKDWSGYESEVIEENFVLISRS